MATAGALADWLAILLVFRERLITGSVVVLAVLGHAATIRHLYISKLNTMMWIVLIGVSLFEGGSGGGIPGLAEALTDALW